MKQTTAADVRQHAEFARRARRHAPLDTPERDETLRWLAAWLAKAYQSKTAWRN